MIVRHSASAEQGAGALVAKVRFSREALWAGVLLSSLAVYCRFVWANVQNVLETLWILCQSQEANASMSNGAPRAVSMWFFSA